MENPTHPTQEQWNYALDRATADVAADVDTMGDWLAAQVSGESCDVDSAVMAALSHGYEDLTGHQLFALMFSSNKQARSQASWVLRERYLAHRAADVQIKANEYVLQECAA